MDRDGVLNLERGEYTFRTEEFHIPDDAPSALRRMKDHGFLLIVITNQAGLSKNIYTREQMEACHSLLMGKTGKVIDDIYYSPYHPEITESLSRKPGTLLFERAAAKYHVDFLRSWMIGDSERDMIPAIKLGIQTILLGDPSRFPSAAYFADSLSEAVKLIIDHSLKASP